MIYVWSGLYLLAACGVLACLMFPKYYGDHDVWPGRKALPASVLWLPALCVLPLYGVFRLGCYVKAHW